MQMTRWPGVLLAAAMFWPVRPAAAQDQAAVSITGTVHVAGGDHMHQEPGPGHEMVDGASVRVLETGYVAETNERGEFTLGPLPPGEYVLEARRIGFRPVRQAYVMRCERSPAVPEGPFAGLEIALARPEDAKAILAIYLACGFESRSEERMRAVLEDGRHAHAVARSGDEVVAFVELETHWPRRVWVAYVGVAQELRDRGLGSALVAFALADAFALGAKSALLMLSPANRSALRAYEKVGFRRHRVVDVLERPL